MSEVPERDDLNLVLAVGIFTAAIGGTYIFSLLRIFYFHNMFFYAYEPLAGLAGGIGIWYAGRAHSVRNGLLGALAALLAIMLVEFLDLYLLRHEMWSGSLWSDAAERFSPSNWLKWLKIFFGIYIGWFVGYRGRRE